MKNKIVISNSTSSLCELEKRLRIRKTQQLDLSESYRTWLKYLVRMRKLLSKVHENVNVFF